MTATALATRAASGEPDLLTHRRNLALDGRCPWCAEAVGSVPFLRGRACPRCASPLRGSGVPAPDAVVDGLRGRWARARWLVFPAIAACTALAGLVPLLAAFVRAASMLAVHVVFVRRPLGWLDVERRIAAKLSLRLYLAALIVLASIVDAVVAPFPLLNAVVSGVTSLVVTIVYAESALRFVTGRMRAQARGAPPAWWEWALPAGALALLVGFALALAGALLLLVKAVAELPSAEQITDFVFE